MITIFYLVISFGNHWNEGAVAIPQPSKDACMQAAVQMKKDYHVDSVYCVQGIMR